MKHDKYQADLQHACLTRAELLSDASIASIASIIELSEQGLFTLQPGNGSPPCRQDGKKRRRKEVGR